MSNIARPICIEIMEFLIVKHSPSFLSSIEELDTFPQDAEFENIQNVYKSVKFGDVQPTLEQEINFFLKHADRTARLDSLIHLKRVLSEGKKKLKELYNKLQDVRGFSEDCEKSLLHRLISVLSKISCSDNQEVGLAASICLGEIGPADLTTIVLQPERIILDLKCSPFEQLSGHVIFLLSQYVVDQDIQVVKIASESLYNVLDSKEGQKIGESNINFGFGPTLKQDILPYFPLTKSPASSINVDVDSFMSHVDQTELWCHSAVISHDNWITHLVCIILGTFSNGSYLKKLIPICEVKPKFCESLLPHIVNLLLHLNKPEITRVLYENINLFFTLHWKNTVSEVQNEEPITRNKKSIRCMLQTINFVRMQRHFNESQYKHVGELHIDYLKVAKASQFCGLHFSALFYSELWCQSKIKEMQDEDKNICEQRSSMIDCIYERQEQEVGEALQNILRNTYKAIGDLDALPGCGTYFLLKPQSRVEHYKEHNKWDQVTHFYSEQLFHGTNQIPLLCSKEMEEPQYECLWRLSQWDAADNRRISYENTMNLESFEKYRFYSLKSLHENNIFSFKDGHKWQNMCLLENLKHRSFESTHNLYPILAHFQSLVEMEDFAEACSKESFVGLLTKWRLQDTLIKGNDFKYMDPIITQRLVMLTDYLKKQDHDVVKNYTIKLVLDFAALAKDEGYFKEGFTIMNNLKYLSDLSEDVKTRIQLMDAQLSWMMDDKLLARHILNTICKKSEVNPKFKSLALKMLGQYMSETYTENRLVVITDYFLSSIATLIKSERTEEDNNTIMDTYDKLAQFADREYQQISTYMKSDLFQRKVANMEKARQTASTIKKQHRKTQDESRAATIHDRNSNIDENEIISAKQESNHLLQLALKYYLLNLSATNNIRIFRIVSLFLENRNNTFITDTINTYMQKISSYKYIPVLPQLIPHITDSSTDLFSSKVNEVVRKCATDHPHHTLPLLLALANANKDREFSDQKTNTSQNDNRMTTAMKLLSELKRKGQLLEHINKLQQLSLALIDLAYYQDPNYNPRQHEFNIPRSQKIMKIRNFDDILLPTHNLKVNPSCNYSNIVGIVSFGNVYHPVGGINAPKRITCQGTDGKKRSQLIKGHDDLRQDAVMQQVFTIMNDLLLSNKETKNLFIRTYKIVPLSMRSGILEWVDNSIPIGNYLIGVDKGIGAHQKFRPKDKSPASCRELFKRAATQSAEVKLTTYKEICHKFKPVFHKFFENYFPQATVWYERRRAYIHSVATTSMCGYILGIGDRHVSNILVDTNTAEVIHIDFGIAFEQGRVLPTPETVPFRLTRDIVDGMGVSGVEGIFKRSCEKTMKVLRQNSQTIITILEVLLYDPLYAWTVTSAEANKRQTDEDIEYGASGSSEEEATVNLTAERALLRLREKLQGMELGHPTSIEHQVGTLIQQAIDPANLCKLFHGWQPYL